MQKFESISTLKSFLTVSCAEEMAVQSLDLSEIEPLMLNIRFSKCLFLGCTMSNTLEPPIARKLYFPCFRCSVQHLSKPFVR